jgi:5S rRNA maturation endonuclease (ribonuclease M5)
MNSYHLNSRSIRFTMYKANGGMVIETEHYNDKNDQRINSLYVCTDTDNLGEELSKILTLESLKQ